MENNTLWEEKSYTEQSKKSESSGTIVQNDTTTKTKRRAMKNQWKDTGKISGIYILRYYYIL